MPVTRRWLAAVGAAVILGGCGGTPPGVEKAEKLLEQGRYHDAEAEADRELERFRKHPTLWKVKIRAAMGRGDNAAAVSSYRDWREIRGAEDTSMLRTMAMTVLWQGLRAPSPTMQADVIRVIERLELEPFARAVGEKVVDDVDLVAAAASVALLRSHPAAPRVATDLLRSEDAAARAIVLEGIARKIGEPARADLLPLLGDREPRVRLAAARAIGNIRVAEDTPKLLELATSDPDGPVRAAALTALARGDREGVVYAARAALDDDYLGARLAALALLDRAGGDAVTPELEEQARSTDPFVALRAAKLVRDRTGESIEAPLLSAIEDDAWSVRVAACGAAADIAGKERALVLLGARLADPSAPVRLAAARALLRWGLEKQAVPVFVQALSAPRDATRIHGARQLASLRDPRGLAALSELMKAADPDTREAAAAAHVHAGRPSDGLIEALADENADVRVEAAETILEMAQD